MSKADLAFYRSYRAAGSHTILMTIILDFNKCWTWWFDYCDTQFIYNSGYDIKHYYTA